LGAGVCALLATLIFPNVFNFFRGSGGAAAVAAVAAADSSGEEDEISVSVPSGLISSISGRSSSSLSVSLAPPLCSLPLPLPLPLSSSVSPSIISILNPSSLPSLP
jgi:hypothetical protein